MSDFFDVDKQIYFASIQPSIQPIPFINWFREITDLTIQRLEPINEGEEVVWW